MPLFLRLIQARRAYDIQRKFIRDELNKEKALEEDLKKAEAESFKKVQRPKANGSIAVVLGVAPLLGLLKTLKDSRPDASMPIVELALLRCSDT